MKPEAPVVLWISNTLSLILPGKRQPSIPFLTKEVQDELC